MAFACILFLLFQQKALLCRYLQGATPPDRETSVLHARRLIAVKQGFELLGFRATVGIGSQGFTANRVKYPHSSGSDFEFSLKYLIQDALKILIYRVGLSKTL